MSGEADGPETDPGGGEPGAPVEALRAAVERTLVATAGSASEAGQRARELLDDVTRVGEAARSQVTRRGEAAREQVDRRRRTAREQLSRRRAGATEELVRRGEEAGERLADAIAELRQAERGDLGPINDGLAAIEGRLEELERVLRWQPRDSDAEKLRKAPAPTQADTNPQPEAEEAPSEADSDAGSRD